MCQLVASGGQSIGVSAAVFPMNIQDWFSFRIDWFDLLAVQGALKSLLQSHNWKASILWCLEFFVGQFSHPYMNTKKTIALSMQTFVGKVMSILFYTLSRFVIAFLPRSKGLLNSWLKSLSCVWLFVTPWTVVCQTPPSMGVLRQEYWSVLPFPSPGDLPDPGIKPRSPTLPYGK